MSFLDSILKKKKQLSHCSTTVTKLSGEKITETLDNSGHVTVTHHSERHPGFIHDFTPDLQVAEILPYLTLGAQDVVTDAVILKNNKISHVLSVGVRIFQQYDGIKYKFVDLYDLPEVNLLAVLPPAFEFINDAQNSGGKVFVHCNAGCSRAPSVVIGYLMSTKKLTYRDAHLMVSDKRYIRPNEGFVHQLRQLEAR